MSIWKFNFYPCFYSFKFFFKLFMGIIDLVNRPLYNIFVLLSLGLYFNQKVKYISIGKKWIIIKKKKIIWNHRYAELRHVINNIKLKSKHFDCPPKIFCYQSKLINLNYPTCTKYEKFTSQILNDILLSNNNIKKVKLMHIKNTRGNSKDDVPLMSLQMIEIDKPRCIYKLSDSYELEDFVDLLFKFNEETMVICFTDWRDLYRNGFSLSHAKFFFLNNYITKIINKIHVYIFSITMMSDTMFAIDMVNN